MVMKLRTFFYLVLVITACQTTDNHRQLISQDSIPNNKTELSNKSVPLHDTAFVNLKLFSDNFAYDMRYATSENFLKKKVYSCDNCLLRNKVAKALIEVNERLNKRGLKIKLFDCFRPVAVQQKMWEIMPDSRYVANPNINGSIHNRGAAVDLTIITSENEPLDMGTSFDHFEKEAHHTFTNLPDSIIRNRLLLKQVMEDAGFSAIETEWWHYTFGKKEDFAISTHPLCD